MNLIAPDKVQHAKDAAQEFAEERVDLLLDALSDDRDMALESLDEDRALQEQTMVDATASASTCSVRSTHSMITAAPPRSTSLRLPMVTPQTSPSSAKR